MNAHCRQVKAKDPWYIVNWLVLPDPDESAIASSLQGEIEPRPWSPWKSWVEADEMAEKARILFPHVYVLEVAV